MKKDLKQFIMESIDNYIIPLTPNEIKHFKITLKLDQKIKKQFPQYETALVGGACRDLFYRKFFGKNNSKEVDDLDFSIYHKGGSGLNDQELTELMNFIKKDPDFSVVDEIKFLHLKIIHKPTGYEIEYTSTRKEAYRDDSRKPETQVGTLVDDILRRDFTVNAIYVILGEIIEDNIEVYLANEKMIEFVNDVQNQILRSANPDIATMLNDDPIRLLRFFRMLGN